MTELSLIFLFNYTVAISPILWNEKQLYDCFIMSLKQFLSRLLSKIISLKNVYATSNILHKIKH